MDGNGLRGSFLLLGNTLTQSVVRRLTKVQGNELVVAASLGTTKTVLGISRIGCCRSIDLQLVVIKDAPIPSPPFAFALGSCTTQAGGGCIYQTGGGRNKTRSRDEETKKKKRQE